MAPRSLSLCSLSVLLFLFVAPARAQLAAVQLSDLELSSRAAQLALERFLSIITVPGERRQLALAAPGWREPAASSFAVSSGQPSAARRPPAEERPTSMRRQSTSRAAAEPAGRPRRVLVRRVPRPAPAPAPAPAAPAAPPPRSAIRHHEPAVLPVESSQTLLEWFRAQGEGAHAAQPAILQSQYDSAERELLPDDDDDDRLEPVLAAPPRPAAPAPAAPPRPAPPAPAGRAAAPPPPRFPRPLKLRGVLTVPRADFSEAYTVWWNPITGDSRIFFQEGSTVTFRKMLPGGLVQKSELHVDRAAGRATRRCGRSTVAAADADRALPALPDLRLFTFAGYEDSELGPAERWEHTVQGEAGGAGAARGEALRTRHSLLLARGAGEAARPLRYEVTTDSSVLGDACDAYRHEYTAVHYHEPGPDFFDAELATYCDEVKQLNASSPDDLARLEPLREYTLPQRDPRYDTVLERYKRQHDRQFVDDAEEAVRKNVLMQSSRLVQSGNRAGATCALGLNLLADRLEPELRRLRGAAPDAGGLRAEPFPYPRKVLNVLEAKLPGTFDWRALGAVSHVRYQGPSCSSCWAFAVTGAVEGALFRRTRRLTPLSEQQLVDCGHTFGAKGCNASWPSRAYHYVQERGLAALDAYTPYHSQVGNCREDAVQPVTRISGYVNVARKSLPALQVAIHDQGPVVVIVKASKAFLFYKYGVFYDERCNTEKSEAHAVLAVGWSAEPEPHLIIKNSHSARWGEEGYMRLQARANTCGVLDRPSYPRLEREDVS